MADENRLLPSRFLTSRADVGPTQQSPPTSEESRQESLVLSPLIDQSGPTARFAVDEFFHADVRNAHTRKAYRFAVTQFLKFADADIQKLSQITPAHVGRYFDSLNVSPTTKKLHLSALRNFFDRMVNRHVMVLNPAHSVRAERTESSEGKTAEIPPAEVRQLLNSIDVSHVIGQRDRLVVALLAFTAARVGAIARLKCRDIDRNTNSGVAITLQEKRGKMRRIPVRCELADYLILYQAAANLDSDSPLLQSTTGRTRQLTGSPMSPADIRCMLKRRLKDANLSTHYSAHSFRVMCVTDLLSQGVPLEQVQYLAGHSDPRTTRLYDRRQQEVTRNLVERISV